MIKAAHAFYRDPDGRWYIDLPSDEVSKPDCEMVAGADTMLDILSEGRQRVRAVVTDHRMPGVGWTHLELTRLEVFGGATYNVAEIVGVPDANLSVWLCPVTMYVFAGQYPDVIGVCVLGD